MASFAIGALFAAACSTADPASTTQSVASVTGTGSSTSTSSTSSTAPATTGLGPTITYDPAVPRFGGDVVIADIQEPATLNPYAPGGDDPMVAIVGQAHLAGAYDVDSESLELIPELVTQIPTVSNGGVVVNDDGSMDVTWEIRPEAQWSDGTPISGADFAFTLEFREASAACSELGLQPEPLPDLEVTAVGDKSLTARFATASLEYELLFEWIVPVAIFESDWCEDWNFKTWPAAGPFVFDRWVRDGTERYIRFVRNENYWKKDSAGNRLPYLDAVEFRFVAETEDLLFGFEQRRYDVINPAPLSLDIPIESYVAGGADVQIVPGPVWEHFNFQFGPRNRNEESLNQYVEFRRAIAYGIDRRALLSDAGYPWFDVSNGFVTRFTPAASNEPWARYGYDPVLARSLLLAACDLAGRDCEADPPQIVYSSTSNAAFPPAVADQLVAQLSDIGIEVSVELEDSQDFFGITVIEGSWDMGSWALRGAPGSTPLIAFFDRFAPAEPPPEGRNVYNWGTPGSVVEGDDALAQFNLILEALRSATDYSQVAALAGQAEELLADQVVIIPLNARSVIGIVWADEIQGYRMNPSGAGHTWNIESWYRVGE